MGMTITDNIDFLNEAKKLFEDIANNPSINETVKAYFTIESLESAMEVMRKYQRIVRIMERTVEDGTSMYDTLQEIEEVVEDGNE